MKALLATVILTIVTSLLAIAHPTTGITDRVSKAQRDPLGVPSITGWNIDVVDVMESGRCLAIELSGDIAYASFEATLALLTSRIPRISTRSVTRC